MPFKVRFRLIAFMGDEEKYPCHFGYKIGDEIIYDGEKFTGRICLSLLPNMAPAVKILHDLGGKGSMRSLIQYSGHSKRDPGMKKYDGLGYAPFKEDPSRGSMSAMQAGALAVSCNDSRTSALLVAEPFGLASAGFDMPYYMREMSILEKVQKEPGIKMDEVINRFTDWERDEIFPPLTPIIVELMLDEPVETGYVKVLEGTVYPQEGIAR